MDWRIRLLGRTGGVRILRLVIPPSGTATREDRFGGFDVPITVFVPEEAVEYLSGFVETIAGKGFGDLMDGLIQLQQYPFIIAAEQFGGDFALHFTALHLAEA